MASIKNCVKVCQELSPCIVNGQKGLFHCWEQRSEIVPPSPMKGGHSGGIIKYILVSLSLKMEAYINAIQMKLNLLTIKLQNMRSFLERGDAG